MSSNKFKPISDTKDQFKINRFIRKVSFGWRLHWFNQKSFARRRKLPLIYSFNQGQLGLNKAPYNLFPSIEKEEIGKYLLTSRRVHEGIKNMHWVQKDRKDKKEFTMQPQI